MWYLKNIPKVLYVYWGGGRLSYLRYLTISTFKHYNPEWDIVLCRPTVEQFGLTWATPEQRYAQNFIDYYEKVKELGITIREINFISIGFSCQVSEVHKSDFLRWSLLSTFGGFWCDMDILFTAPMDKLYFNTEENANINTVFCISHYGHSIGFLMASPDNQYFKRIHDNARQEYRKEKYQGIGSLLCNKLFPSFESAQTEDIVPHNLAMDVVYAYDSNHVKEIFSTHAPNRFTQNSIGLHWYAGSKLAGVYLNNTNGGLIINQTLIGKLTKQFNESINSDGVLQPPKVVRPNLRIYQEITNKGLRNYRRR